MVDQFTVARITKVLTEFRQRHGRDLSMAELNAHGFSDMVVDNLVRKGILGKYQITCEGGRRENRFKLAVDWRSLKG